MEFRVWRSERFICTVEIQKVNGEWEPLDDAIIIKGDILENMGDGIKLEVLYHNPKKYFRPGLKMQVLEDKP